MKDAQRKRIAGGSIGALGAIVGRNDERQSQVSQTGQFHITIGSTPVGLTLEQDLRMVKAALLYADSVTLCSFTSFMVTELRTLVSLNYEQQLAYLRPLLPKVATNKESAVRVQQAFNKYDRIRKKAHLSATDRQWKHQFDQLLEQSWQEMRILAEQQFQSAGGEQMIKATQSGLLTLHKFRPTENSDEQIKEYFDLVSDVIVNGRSQPMFDEETSRFVRAGVAEGIIKISEAGVRKGRQSHLALELLQRLPLFELASVDEILDIRKELEAPLIRFRSAIMRFSREIQSAAWDDAFPHEAEEIFHREVVPAVLDIEEAVKANRQFLPLIKKLAGGLTQGTLVAYIATNAAIPEVIAQGLGISLAALSAYDDIREQWRAKAREIEQKHMYFYYRAGRALGTSGERKLGA